MRRRLPLTSAASAVSLVLAISMLAACDGSSASSTAAFTARGRAACRAYLKQLAGLSRANASSPDAAEAVARGILRATDVSLVRLRALVPPSSTGVDADEWHRVIDGVRHDLRAVDRFYAREYPRLLRAYYEFHPVRATDNAPTLAEAYDSPAGRRFLRLEQRLKQRHEVDDRALLRLEQRVGLLRVCRAP